MTEKEFSAAWADKLSSKGIKKFPSDFITPDIQVEEIILPQRALVIGNEFFGAYEILTVDGSLFQHAESYEFAKYIIYANRLKPGKVNIPVNDMDIKKINSAYEKYLDSIIKEIETEYKKLFPPDKSSRIPQAPVSNDIFRILNLTRL